MKRAETGKSSQFAELMAVLMVLEHDVEQWDTAAYIYMDSWAMCKADCMVSQVNNMENRLHLPLVMSAYSSLQMATWYYVITFSTRFMRSWNSFRRNEIES